MISECFASTRAANSSRWFANSCATATQTEKVDSVITGIHHVQITIPRDAEKDAHAFYCDVLALPEIRKPDSLAGRGGFWLQVGDRAVHVGVEDGVDRSRTKSHIAYAVSDLAYWRQRLQAHEVEILESIPIFGHDRFEFRDPFGNRVEMIQPL